MKNNYEQMTSSDDQQGEEQYLKVKRNITKTGGLMKLSILIGVIFFFLIMIYLLISKSSQVSQLKTTNNQLTSQYKELKKKENELQDNYNHLNQEKSEMDKRSVDLNNEIMDYKSKNDKINAENSKVNENIVQLEDQLKKLTNEVNSLQSTNEQTRKRVEDLNAESQTYDKEIDDLNKKISELESKLGNNQGGNNSLRKLASNIVVTEFDIKFFDSLLPNASYKLLYRKSKHEYSPEAFHRLCDDAGKTITFVQINDERQRYIIGGYTSKSWKPSNGRTTFKPDPDAFIFNLSRMKVFHVQKIDEAIICDPDNFTLFNYDLQIVEKGIHSTFPMNYGNKNDDSNYLTSGATMIPKNFIEEMEVFQVEFN